MINDKRELKYSRLGTDEDNKVYKEEIILDIGQTLFILGANGSGKSSLIIEMVSGLEANLRHSATLLIGHRDISLPTNEISVTSKERKSFTRLVAATSNTHLPRIRYEQDIRRSKSSFKHLLYDLAHSRHIVGGMLFDAYENGDGDPERLKSVVENNPDKFKIINDILLQANLNFELLYNIEKEEFSVSRNNFPKYIIQKLSDGERNALLLIMEVILAEDNTLVFLDEPERHLNRAIAVPLLNLLIAERPDCNFVVATHDISAPLNCPTPFKTLLSRAYCPKPEYWDCDLIEDFEDIDEDIMLAILGSRKKILVTEGNDESLDIRLYRLLFQDVTVLPVGNCVEVERVIKGLTASKAQHWISAIGIIDRDNRSEEECNELKSKSVIALEQYSIESIYYHPSVIDAVLRRNNTVTGIDVNTAKSQYESSVLNIFAEKTHREHLTTILILEKVKTFLASKVPSKEDLKIEDSINVAINVKDFYKDEEATLDTLLKEKDIAGLIGRYPLKKTPAMKPIVNALGFVDINTYEGAVLKMVTDSDPGKETILKLVKEVSNALERL